MKTRGYWTKNKCQEEALKYKNRTDFQIKSVSAYISSRKNKWLDEICSHMVIKIKPNGYWTKDICQNESLKYTTKTEFNNNSPKAYQHAWKNGWLDEICSHMNIVGSKYERCIYVYEFSDKSAYVGLTYNVGVRHKNHISDINSPVFKKIKENISFKHIILTNYVDVEQSKKLEYYYVEEYRKNNWIILNKSTTGGLGGKFIKWTKDMCYIESLKYNIKSELKKNNGSAYNVIKKNKWDDEMFSHMKSPQKPTGYWNIDKCKNEANKYKNKKDFKKYSKAYSPSCKKGWLDEICSHMI